MITFALFSDCLLKTNVGTKCKTNETLVVDISLFQSINRIIFVLKIKIRIYQILHIMGKNGKKGGFINRNR